MKRTSIILATLLLTAYLSGCYEMMSAGVDVTNAHLAAEIVHLEEKRKQERDNTAIELELRRIEALETSTSSMSKTDKQEYEKNTKLKLSAFFYGNKKVLGSTDAEIQEMSNAIVASSVPITVYITFIRNTISQFKLGHVN